MNKDKKPKFGQLKIDKLDIYNKDKDKNEDSEDYIHLTSEDFKDSKFNDKNIFTNNYESPLIYKSKPMSEEDRSKFIKLNENLKLKIVETLLDNEENTKIMENNMKNILAELNKFKDEVKDMREKRDEEIRVKEEQDKYSNSRLDEIINRDKIREVSSDSYETDSRGIYSGVVTVGHHGFLENYDASYMELCTVKTKLKDILDNISMSQTYLCRYTGINRSTMSYILSNTDSMSLKNAFKISKFLKIPIEDIFDFDIEVGNED